MVTQASPWASFTLRLAQEMRLREAQHDDTLNWRPLATEVIAPTVSELPTDVDGVSHTLQLKRILEKCFDRTVKDIKQGRFLFLDDKHCPNNRPRVNLPLSRADIDILRNLFEGRTSVSLASLSESNNFFFINIPDETLLIGVGTMIKTDMEEDSLMSFGLYFIVGIARSYIRERDSHLVPQPPHKGIFVTTLSLGHEVTIDPRGKSGTEHSIILNGIAHCVRTSSPIPDLSDDAFLTKNSGIHKIRFDHAATLEWTRTRPWDKTYSLLEAGHWMRQGAGGLLIDMSQDELITEDRVLKCRSLLEQINTRLSPALKLL